MDLQAVLTEVRSWAVEDRLRLIEVVWDEIAALETEEELSDDLKRLLDQRIAHMEAHPEAVSSLEEVWARLADRISPTSHRIVLSDQAEFDVKVFAILHGSRSDDVWKSRL